VYPSLLHDRAYYDVAVRYLSLQWIEAVAEEASRHPAVADAAATSAVGVTQVVTDGPEGTIVYFLQAANGDFSFGPGEAFPEDVRFQQTWETAVGVARGTINSQDAFIHGRILLTGSQQKLMDNQAIFAAMSPVFDAVREHTEYE
jgi:SCP-2 sterol transfer family